MASFGEGDCAIFLCLVCVHVCCNCSDCNLDSGSRVTHACCYFNCALFERNFNKIYFFFKLIWNFNKKKMLQKSKIKLDVSFF